MVWILKFDNGLRVVYHPDRNRRKAGFSICLNVGGIHESKFNDLSKAGIAHFQEHLMFKSNKEKNYEDLYKSLTWKGSDYNAETSLWYTNFYGSTRANLENVLQTFFEAYTNLDFDNAEFENEKSVVLNEELTYKSNIHNYIVEDLLIPALFQGTSLNRKIRGNKSSIKNISVEDIVAFKKKFYVPNNTVIGLSGNVDMRTLKPFLEKTYGSLASKESKRPKLKLTPSPNYGMIQKQIKGGIPSNYLVIGFLAPEEDEKSAVLADFLNDILSLDFSSRINLELREKRGIGYEVGSNYDSDQGFMYLYVDCFKPEQLDEAREGLYKVINDVVEKGIPAEEVNGVKELLINHYLSDDSDLEGVAKSLAEQEALKLPYDVLDLEKKLKRVTPYQLNRFAKKLLRQDKVEILVKVRPD